MRKAIRQYMEQLSVDKNEAVAEFVFSKGFCGFQGHFPDNPIVPGVCLIQCALVLTEEICGRKVRLCLINSAKFMAAIEPAQSVRLKCSVSDDFVDACFMSGEERVAAVKLRFVYE
jgi:3-hydroxyacyl-[acyl-carrier-protein] dehydratase